MMATVSMVGILKRALPAARRSPIIRPVSTYTLGIGRVGLGRVSISRSTLRLLGLVSLLLAALVMTSHVATSLFYVVAAGLLALLAYLSYRSPRVMLIAVVFMPIVDRYLVSLLIAPGELQNLTHYTSEALLLLVSVSIGVRGLMDGSLWPALRHPVVALLVAFAAVGAFSAVVNGVPPVIAAAGIGFTIEASVLFVLPRVIGFRPRHAAVAAIGFTAVATLAAVLALGQVIIHPNFLGLESFAGRFAEGQRVAAFLVNPNMLGAVVAMGVPFPAILTIRADRPAFRWLALGITFVLVLALFYSFSRGAWLGLALGMLVVGIAVEARALLVLIAVGAMAFGSALVIPHHIVTAGDTGFDLGGATLGRFDSLEGGSDLRVLFIRNATPIILDHPIIGVGPGRYGGAVARDFGTPLSTEYTDGSVPLDRTVDNFWLHLVVEFGVLGALLLAGALGLAIWELIAAARHMSGLPRALLGAFAAVGILLVVDSLAEMLLEGNTTSFTLWFFLGVGSAIVSAAKRAPSTLRAR
jgi:O-antigen ligase